MSEISSAPRESPPSHCSPRRHVCANFVSPLVPSSSSSRSPASSGSRWLDLAAAHRGGTSAAGRGNRSASAGAACRVPGHAVGHLSRRRTSTGSRTVAASLPAIDWATHWTDFRGARRDGHYTAAADSHRLDDAAAAVEATGRRRLRVVRRRGWARVHHRAARRATKSRRPTTC